MTKNTTKQPREKNTKPKTNKKNQGEKASR